MERLIFDSDGRLKGVNNSKFQDPFKNKFSKQKPQRKLKTSENLEFLNQESPKIDNIFEHNYWSFYTDGKSAQPLKFSNGKTQEDIVREVVDSIKEGHKVIFLHGTCGTGKSAIALNIARILGRASIVVPVKALQKQYEQDYLKKNHILNLKGEKMRIAMVTGRDNHDSLIKPGISCADPSLPENIKFIEKNYNQILEYYKDNPYISNDQLPDFRKLRRIAVAPANPYWSPIIPSGIDLKQIKDASRKKYAGCDGREYTFYHRKRGCSYYDQYLSYMVADVIIFNSAKYLSELYLGRKPLTEIEIIDEADDFLDSLFQQESLNLSRIASSLKVISPDSQSAREDLDGIMDLLALEEKNKKATGVDENKVFHINETKLRKVLEILNRNSELESEIAIDELNYANKILEAARNFKENLDDVYLTFRRDDEFNLHVKLVSTNLSAKFKDIMSKSKALVFMSGTLHSEQVIKNIFNIEDYKVIEAETLNLGSIEILRTGKEFDCKYANFKSGIHSREEYLKSLSSCIDKAESPALIHVNAFKDLPTEMEKMELSLTNLLSSERLKEIQREDKTGNEIINFKSGNKSELFTTKCSRGVDFPGDTCKSIVFTKYPNPNISDTFWKILNETHPDYFWEFYKDKARREFLQRIYRALRSKDDHVYILSPDTRVLDAVRELQLELDKQNKN